jgi:hypothetical protein
MDPSEMPNMSQGSSGTASPYTPFHNITRRPTNNHSAQDNTSQQQLGNTLSFNNRGVLPADTLGPLPTIVEIPDTGEEGEPQTDVNIRVQGATLAPLIGTNLKSLENPSGSSEDSASKSSIHTGKELEDSDVETVLEATIASYNISRRTIVDALKEQAWRHIDNALKLKEGGLISDQEYIRIAKEVVNYKAKCYIVKKHLHTKSLWSCNMVFEREYIGIRVEIDLCF